MNVTLRPYAPSDREPLRAALHEPELAPHFDKFLGPDGLEHKLHDRRLAQEGIRVAERGRRARRLRGAVGAAAGRRRLDDDARRRARALSRPRHRHAARRVGARVRARRAPRARAGSRWPAARGCRTRPPSGWRRSSASRTSAGSGSWSGRAAALPSPPGPRASRCGPSTAASAMFARLDRRLQRLVRGALPVRGRERRDRANPRGRPDVPARRPAARLPRRPLRGLLPQRAPRDARRDRHARHDARRARHRARARAAALGRALARGERRARR